MIVLDLRRPQSISFADGYPNHSQLTTLRTMCPKRRAGLHVAAWTKTINVAMFPTAVYLFLFSSLKIFSLKTNVI